MLRALAAGKAGDLAWFLADRPFNSPIGVRTLLPGFQQYRWGQYQRGWAFFGIIRISVARRPLGLGIAAFLGLPFARACNPRRFGH